MAKIMLVEDDNNLREIYEARLAADGYEIIAAQDGEEALAMAVKEKPDLIISDIMMPKISGFDMLDILRSTPETKDTKVIMMTALSQAEDKVRAAQMGADRYLVKSQVTLEDVAKVAREILNGNDAEQTSPATQPADHSSTAPANVSAPAPAEPAVPVTAPTAQTVPVAVAPSEQTADQPIQTSAASLPSEPQVPASTSPTDPPEPVSTSSATPTGNGAAEPPEHITPADSIDPTLAESAQAETATIEAQISDFVEHATPEPDAPVAPQSALNIGISADGVITQGITAEEQKPTQQPTSPAEQPAPVPPPAAIPPAPTPPPAPPVPNSPQTTLPVPAIPVANPAPQPTNPPPTHIEVKTPEVKTAVQPVHQKVIQPINDLSKSSVDLNALLAQEQAKAAGAGQVPPVQAFVSPEIQAENEAAAAAANQQSSAPLPGTTFDPNSVAL